jgi:hypothetical protein
MLILINILNRKSVLLLGDILILSHIYSLKLIKYLNYLHSFLNEKNLQKYKIFKKRIKVNILNMTNNIVKNLVYQ